MAEVKTDFVKKTAQVTMQPGKTLTREDCDAAFLGSQYGVTAFGESP